jgi:1-acyl-sn-glycerol-3-phosphate acyltransferase
MNHQSFKDPLMMYKIFPRRRVYILTAEVVFDGHKFRSYMLRQLGCIRIDRNIYDKEAIDLAADIVKAGNLVVVFASGHIDKENISGFKAGASLVASRAGAPIYTILSKIEGKKNYIYLGKKYSVLDNDGKRLNSKNLKLLMENIHDDLFKLGDDDEI